MLVTVLSFLGLLLLLVLVHEWGHFSVARKCGIGVEEFGFGFPPRLASIVRRGVVYSFNWIPLGGFVRLKGENGDQSQEPDSFAAASAGKRTLVLVAGITMNVVLAYVLLVATLVIGQPSVVDSTNAAQARAVSIQLVEVEPGSPAAQAGVTPGSQIVDIDGQVFPGIPELQAYVAEHSGGPVTLSLQKDGKLFQHQLTPLPLSSTSGRAAMGVSLVGVGTIIYPWYEALWRGAALTGILSWEIIVAFTHMFRDLIVSRQVPADVAGPVGIAVLTGQVVSLGWAYVLQFAALLSLNLAIINLLPLPALDGGRVLFVIIEKLRGKANSAYVERVVHTVGFALLMLLAVAITYRDIVRLGGGFFNNIFS